MGREAFVVGVDFGTDSVRAIIVNALDGAEVATSVFTYPRWDDKLYCDPSRNQFRQHPLDYIEGLEAGIKKCVKEAGRVVARKIRGLSVDTTGSSPVATDRQGRPLALHDSFKDNPNAMFVLWKDHTATPEAAEINDHASKFEVNYLKYVGGIYSSEWFWAKLLHILREDQAVREACYSWAEHCDWMPHLLTGGADVHAMRRGVCAAGHKALWAPEFGGLPPDDFFSSLDPLLKSFTARLYKETFTADQPAGIVSTEWAERLGIPADTVVGIGAFDAHMGAVGGQIEAHHLSKVMGTSTCDMLVVPRSAMSGKLVRGICGQVDGSIIPGMIGLEAGQSAFGDTYAWLRDLLMWPLLNLESPEVGQAQALKQAWQARIIAELSRKAATLPLSESDELALDWLNGRRTPDANQELTAAITGLRLGTGVPQLFKALVEATCFGARAIVERFAGEGVPVHGLIGLGGIALKSPYIMQAMADVMDMPMRIHRSEQTCALGAAMFAATACGIYPRVEEAMLAMGHGFERTYDPDKSRAEYYDSRYKKYVSFGMMIQSLTENTFGMPKIVHGAVGR